MYTLVWIVLCAMAILGFCLRSVFIYPEKAHKPVFLVKNAVFAVSIGVVVFVFIWFFNL